MSSTRVKTRKEKQLDFYETPEKVTLGLLKTGFLDDSAIESVLEPSAGSGAIVRCIRSNKPRFKITAVEIQERFAENLAKTGAEVIIEDFLKLHPVPMYDRIIGNPPYSQAEEFVEQCYEFMKPTGGMALLLRLPFIASVKRYNFIQKLRPSAVIVLSQRPKFGGDNIDSCDYAWIVWMKNSPNITVLDWIEPS